MSRFVHRRFSKGSIDRAGAALKANFSSGSDDQFLEIIDNWRSCHAYPLQVIKMTLLKRARRIDPNALVAQRLKRLPSIQIKLHDNPNMELTQMQDIGGCRAVMASVRDVYELAKMSEENSAKNPNTRPSVIERYDYIQRPKADGYRSLHLIYKYQTNSPKNSAFQGQRIEVQVRSKLQHAWATALEIAETFTGLSLKRKNKTTEREWLKFFSLMSGAIASRENVPSVPGIPQTLPGIISEMTSLATEHALIGQLQGFGVALNQIFSEAGKTDDQFLLILDPVKKALRIRRLTPEIAQETYLEEERKANDRWQVVLVTVESLEALRRAYPNYYGDTREFVNTYFAIRDGKLLV